MKRFIWRRILAYFILFFVLIIIYGLIKSLAEIVAFGVNAMEVNKGSSLVESARTAAGVAGMINAADFVAFFVLLVFGIIRINKHYKKKCVSSAVSISIDDKAAP